MKPPPFEYLAPPDLNAALAALAAHPGTSRPLAGGQSLVPMLNFRLAGSELLVDLNRIEELSRIEETDEGGLRIGAMVRQRTLERDPLVRKRAPLVVEAVPYIAHEQIRSRATIGGTVAHADPAAELPAVLLVLGGRIQTARLDGAGMQVDRSIDLCEFFLGPFHTVLEPEEILVSIELPPPGTAEGAAFEELARRRGDYAIVGAAARVRLDAEGVCREAAIALVNAGPTPCLMHEAAAVLTGHALSDERVGSAARLASHAASPAADMHGSVAYRRHLVRVLTERVLGRAARRAGESGE